MKFTYALLITGLIILAGTAGESDRNVYMPMWQMLSQGLLGLALFIWGAVRANKHEEHSS
jgi:hypothetical protein